MPKTVALVGSDSLLGADVRELIGQRLPSVRLRLVGSEEQDSAILTEHQGEAVVMTGLDAANLSQAQAVVLAGGVTGARRAVEILETASSEAPIIDLTGGLEERAEARLRAPEAEPLVIAPARLQVVAHPAAILLARVLRALQRVTAIPRSVAQILAPASEWGRAGVQELQHQTAQLLSFRPLEETVFGAQLSFNLLAGRTSVVESRIDRHLATLLSAEPALRMPSLRVIAVPVMHSFSATLWCESDQHLTPAQVRRALTDDGLDVWPDEPPSPVGVAGQSGVAVGAVEADRNHHRAFWIWVAADNYRLAAENALTLLETALA